MRQVKKYTHMLIIFPLFVQCFKILLQLATFRIKSEMSRRIFTQFIVEFWARKCKACYNFIIYIISTGMYREISALCYCVIWFNLYFIRLYFTSVFAQTHHGFSTSICLRYGRPQSFTIFSFRVVATGV